MEKITIRVTEKEKETIQNLAKSVGKSVTAYIRDASLDLCVLKYDPSDSVEKHTHEISSLRNSINQLIYTIEKTGDYYPAELEAIHGLMVEILESEKKFLAATEKDAEITKKTLKKQVNIFLKDRMKRFEKTE